MGMFAEIAAEQNARRFAEILEKGKESNDPAILKFCKIVVYPLYLNETGEAFMQPDTQIVTFWNSIQGE